MLRDLKTMTVKQANTIVYFDMINKQANPINFDKKFGKVGFKAIIEFDEVDDGHQTEYRTTISYYNKEYEILITL